KLLTVHGALSLSSWMPMSPRLVDMLALTSSGSVGTLPERGGLLGLLAGSVVVVYAQLAPRLGGGSNAGSPLSGVDGAAVVSELFRDLLSSARAIAIVNHTMRTSAMMLPMVIR